MLALLLASAAPAVQPPRLVVHLILAASKSGGRVPTLDARLWPRHVEVRRHSIPDTLGPCTAEAVSYLRGIGSIYAEVRPSDLVVFMHSHEITWHTPTPMQQQQLLKLLSLDYAREEPFGGIYCFDNDRWAAASLVSKATPVSRLWRMMFERTKWEAEAPALHAMQYPCCATFFVQGEVILRHDASQYRQVELNLVENCKREKLLFPANYPTPMARLMEGSWHLFLANITMVPPPPYCSKNQTRWTNSIKNQNHLEKRLERGVNSERYQNDTVSCSQHSPGACFNLTRSIT